MRIVPFAVGLAFLIAAPLVLADEPKRKAGDDVFDLKKVWQIHITIAAKDFAAMEPAMPFGAFGQPGRPGGPQPQPKADKPTDVHKGGSFGIEFPWVRGEVQIGDQKFSNVGLRYKGGGSYMTSMGKLRRNIKLDLDRYEEGQQFHGMKSLNLNAGAMDASRTHEALGFAAFRAAGIPTPRTAFAEVTLTVPGKFDKELVGTYTLIEQVDKTFLKDRFKKPNGLLLKPEVRMNFGNRGPLAYQGDDWEPYKAALLPKREPTKAEAERIIGLIKLIDRGTDEQFHKEIGNYIDVDEFFRFVGMTALVCNLDNFFTGGHNVYIYLDPETNKFVFLPWDLDLAFGGFFLLGQADQQADLHLTHPYPGEHKLVDRLMAIPEMRERYLKLVREMTTKAFNKAKLLGDLDAIERTTKELLAREAKASSSRREQAGFGMPGMPGMSNNQTDLRAWLDKRITSVTAQLDGKSEGTIPRGFGFGPPPIQANRPKPGDVMPGPLQDALGLSPEQRKQFAELQKETETKVKKLLTEEQMKRFQEMRNAMPPGGPGGGPPGPPGGPRPGG